MGYYSIIDRLRDVFTRKAPPKDAMQTLEDLDQFFVGIDAIEKQLQLYNKAIYENGGKKFYNIHYPTPDAGGETSYCYTDGYIIETKKKSIKLYPETYENGLFKVMVAHLDRAENRVTMITKQESVKMNLAQLQTYIKNAVKEGMLNLDDIDYTPSI